MMVRAFAGVVLFAFLSAPVLAAAMMQLLPSKPRMFTRAPIAGFLTWIKALFGAIGTFCGRRPWST